MGGGGWGAQGFLEFISSCVISTRERLCGNTHDVEHCVDPVFPHDSSPQSIRFTINLMYATLLGACGATLCGRRGWGGCRAVMAS
jgi:hypothetical protein